MKIYVIKLTETFKVDSKVTYYKFEMNGILFDTKNIIKASIFDSYEFCVDLTHQIESDYDYITEIIEFDSK